jgi:hypothetical protein
MTGSITTKAVADAVRTVLGLSLNRQEELVDRIYAAQPQILLAVLSLSRDGVPPEMLEHALHLLMVVHTCVTSQCKDGLPAASREDVIRAAGRHESMIAYLEVEPDPGIWRLTATAYPEPALLAYTVNYLLENGGGDESEAQYKVSSMSKVALDLYVDAFRSRREQDAGGKRNPLRAGS